MNYEQLACEALGCKEVISVCHISTIIESMEDPGTELLKEHYIEGKLFDAYDKFVDVYKSYGKNTIGGRNDFFVVDTPLGMIAYITDNYPCMFIPIEK
jgi:hypothetical protein